MRDILCWKLEVEVVLDWWGSMKLLRGWLPRRMIGDDLQGCGGDVFQGPNSAIAARYLVYFLKVSCELIIIRYSDDDELT
jgi:hypothetical protein